uniref:Secreted protein n=1 Tax=Mycena chlorophos TaxID=658473 RepID=A0ABQ0LZH6_MYCCL|nr:predicted protein [Mycena chlorophos]
MRLRDLTRLSHIPPLAAAARMSVAVLLSLTPKSERHKKPGREQSGTGSGAPSKRGEVDSRQDQSELRMVFVGLVPTTAL